MKDKIQFLEESEEKRKDLIRDSLYKMQRFLVEHGVAQSRREVKCFPRIEIKGTHVNGKERLIREEVEQKYDINVLECSVGFNTYYPPIRTGVIKSGTVMNGTYYTMFNVVSETEDDFDLDIFEYIYFNDVFYLGYVISLVGVRKKTPFAPIESSYATIQEFFVNQFSEEERSDFTAEEIDAISDAIPSKANEIIEAVCTTTLSIFRVVNFILEISQSDRESSNKIFSDNEYFSIKNWDDNQGKEIPIHKAKSQFTEEYVDKILNIHNGYEILKAHTIGYVINEIVRRTQVSTFYVAVGFVFQSGLRALSSVFDKLFKNNSECELIVGALQNYDSVISNNKINCATVRHLNTLLTEGNLQLFTYKPSFYHGKFYYLRNNDKAFAVIGSSNISHPAFHDNYELDIIYIMDKDGLQDKMFREWYFNLRKECERIQCLDEKNFSEFNWNCELDAYHSLKDSVISKSEMQKKINQLSDEETKYRMNLWMAKCPTSIYEKTSIGAFENYLMFVYSQEKLVVFESFAPSNAYYVFRIKNDLVSLLEDISGITKSQMSLSACYVNRGYHTISKEKLEKKINDFFDIV